MRGYSTEQRTMLSVSQPEQRVPKDHPLRRIKALADLALTEMDRTFTKMYSAIGRPSIPPERLLKASLLMALYTVRSERLFCEQLDYNLLFRWFLDMDMMEESFDHSTFSQNRERLLEHEVAQRFLATVVAMAQEAGLMSDEHFTVDGTLIEAWASLKSFRPKGDTPAERPPTDDPGNPTVDFHGEKRSNATHASTTDPEARLAKKSRGKEAKLSYAGHVVMENRQGLVVDIHITPATGTAEREEALTMLEEAVPGNTRITVGADKGYDTQGFVRGCRDLHITPHVAQNTERKGGSALDERTTRHEGYGISQRMRKRVEEVYGWMKTVGNFRRTRYKGRDRTQLAASLVAAAYNLLRMGKMIDLTAGECA